MQYCTRYTISGHERGPGHGGHGRCDPQQVERIESVMLRDEHLAASGLTRSEIQQLLDEIATVLIPVRLEFRWRPNLADANDDMVLETAANGGAEALVTFNVRDFAPKNMFGFDVLTPAELMRRMGTRR